jgi:hypothetical protein
VASQVDIGRWAVVTIKTVKIHYFFKAGIKIAGPTLDFSRFSTMFYKSTFNKILLG